jgi:hypothetical protein
MSDLPYEGGLATSDESVPTEGWATQDFEVDLPMDNDDMRQFPQYPWEATPDFGLEPPAFFSPIANAVVIVSAPQRRTQEVAREYVLRVQAQLPPEVRHSFAQGAGMFDFPAPPDLDDHLA